MDWAAVISLRVVLRRTPAGSMSVTVNEVRVATVVDPPMSAWLPITRSSVMCVMTVSLTARISELLVWSRKAGSRCVYIASSVISGGAEVSGCRIVAFRSRRLFMGSRADFWCSSCRISSRFASQRARVRSGLSATATSGG